MAPIIPEDHFLKIVKEFSTILAKYLNILQDKIHIVINVVNYWAIIMNMPNYNYNRYQKYKKATNFKNFF